MVATLLPQAGKSVGVRVHLPGLLTLRMPGLLLLPTRAGDGHCFRWGACPALCG